MNKIPMMPTTKELSEAGITRIVMQSDCPACARLQAENAELKALINGLLAFAKDMMPICPEKARKMIMTAIDKGKELQAECRQDMLNALADDLVEQFVKDDLDSEYNLAEGENGLRLKPVENFIRNWRRPE